MVLIIVFTPVAYLQAWNCDPPSFDDPVIVIVGEDDIHFASYEISIEIEKLVPTSCALPLEGQAPAPEESMLELGSPESSQNIESSDANPLRTVGLRRPVAQGPNRSTVQPPPKTTPAITSNGQSAKTNNASETLGTKPRPTALELSKIDAQPETTEGQSKATLAVEGVKSSAKPVDSTAATRFQIDDREELRKIDVSASLTPDQLRRSRRIKECLAYHLFRPETTAKRSPWGVMHAMLPFGVEAEIINGNKRVNAIGFLCYNGRSGIQQQSLFRQTSNGFTMNIGPGFQGHEGQFLAMLAQSHVGADFPIRVGNRQYTVADLVRYEMAGCVERTELTFKLIGLSHYLKTDQQWVSSQGRRWSIEKLVQEELNQPIVGAACGGTHRLMGLTYAIRKRQREGLPIDGEFYRAALYLNDFIEYAWPLQNPDGSMSTNWFESRGNDNDVDKKVRTTGHILEWLVFALNPKDLESDRVKRSVDFLLSNLLDHRQKEWDIGPRGHALRALALYDQKMFGGEPGQRREELASLNDRFTR